MDLEWLCNLFPPADKLEHPVEFFWLMHDGGGNFCQNLVGIHV